MSHAATTDSGTPDRPTRSVGSGDGFGSSRRRDCNNCRHCLMHGEHITCGLLLAEGDEDDADIADGIHHTFAQECADFEPNS